MDISFKDFVAVCPSAMTPDEKIFNLLSEYIDSRIFLAKGIVTDSVFDKLENIEDDLQNPDYELLCGLKNDIKHYICASAYYIAIPQLDLVLTPTGFGVVSNQNVAPASADRVRELRRQIHLQEMFYFDELIDKARRFVNWQASTHGGYLFTTLFWRGSHMRSFGIVDATRDNLVGSLADIDGAARDMQRTFSPELYKALLKAESTASTTPLQQTFIHMWRQATAAWCRHDGSWHMDREAMLRLIESNIDAFPEYRDSQTYKANHFERYRNEKDDTCFFFG